MSAKDNYTASGSFELTEDPEFPGHFPGDRLDFTAQGQTDGTDGHTQIVEMIDGLKDNVNSAYLCVDPRPSKEVEKLTQVVQSVAGPSSSFPSRTKSSRNG